MSLNRLGICMAALSVFASPASPQSIEQQWSSFTTESNLSLGIPDLGIPGNPVKILEDAMKIGGSVVEAAAKTNYRVLEAMGNEFRDAVVGVLQSGDKLVADTASNLLRSANDIIDAAKAMERYGERQVQGLERGFSDADERARSGDVAGALWHFTTDRAKNEYENSMTAAQESALIDQSMQAAASVGGGPGGAAAYAAAKTYHQTRSLGAALNVGLKAYVTSAGVASVDAIPAGSFGELMKKSAAAGAVGGVIAAASGGNVDDVTKAFVTSGSAVLVQTGTSYAKQKVVNPLIAKPDSYCVSGSGSKCGTARDWYEKNAAKLKSAGPSVSMITSKDGNWVLSWDPDGIKSPDVGRISAVLTNVGERSQYRNLMKTVVDLGTKKISPAAAGAYVPSEKWVALQGYGADTFFFTRALPMNDIGPFKAGDILRADRQVWIRNRMVAYAATPGSTPKVRKNGLVFVKLIRDDIDRNGRSQKWAKIEEVD